MTKIKATWIPFGIGDARPDIYIKPGKLSRTLRDKRDAEPTNAVEAIEARVAEIGVRLAEARPLRVVSVVSSVDRYANTSSSDFAITTDFESNLIPPKLWPPKD